MRFDLEFEPTISFCDLDGRCGCYLPVISMVCHEFRLNMGFHGGYRGYMTALIVVYYEFKPDMSFGGGYRGYMVVIYEVYYEFKMDISFGGWYRDYTAAASAFYPSLDGTNIFNHIAGL